MNLSLASKSWTRLFFAVVAAMLLGQGSAYAMIVTTEGEAETIEESDWRQWPKDTMRLVNMPSRFHWTASGWEQRFDYKELDSHKFFAN